MASRVVGCARLLGAVEAVTSREALKAIYERGGQIKQADGDEEPGWWYLVRESELDAIFEAVKQADPNV